MDAKDVVKQVEELAEQFKADSLYSIDYGRNAKAIAFSNGDVRKKVAEIVAESVPRSVAP